MRDATRWLLAVLGAPALLLLCALGVFVLAERRATTHYTVSSGIVQGNAPVDVTRPRVDPANDPRPTPDSNLLATALAVMPAGLSDGEVRRALRNGLWHEDGDAVAVGLPRANESLTFVFRRQADGSYRGVDASWVANPALVFIGWRRDEFDRFVTEPINWVEGRYERLSLTIRTRAWRGERRYTATESFFVHADGLVTAH